MSMRTLVELNHDYADRLTSPEFQAFLRYYLASGSKWDAEALERFGARVVGLRHHADNWIVDAKAPGFPARYLTRAQGMEAAAAGETRQGLDPKGDSPVGNADAPDPNRSPSNRNP